MATVVKMCDMSANLAAKVFKTLNPDTVILKRAPFGDMVIVTNVEPKDLVYPEGWYYGKGCFRNKHNSTSGIYEEIFMLKQNGDFWGNTAKYCTR